MMSMLQQLPHSVWIMVAGIGAIMLLRSFWMVWKARYDDPNKEREMVLLIWLARGLRYFLSGLCLFGGALGVLYGVKWLVFAALVIGLEELYETTISLFFLRRMAREDEGGQQSFPLLAPGYLPEDASAEEREADRWGPHSRGRLFEDLA